MVWATWSSAAMHWDGMGGEFEVAMVRPDKTFFWNTGQSGGRQEVLMVSAAYSVLPMTTDAALLNHLLYDSGWRGVRFTLCGINGLPVSPLAESYTELTDIPCDAGAVPVGIPVPDDLNLFVRCSYEAMSSGFDPAPSMGFGAIGHVGVGVLRQ